MKSRVSVGPKEQRHVLGQGSSRHITGGEKIDDGPLCVSGSTPRALLRGERVVPGLWGENKP